MSKFRELVEDITNPQSQTPTYVYLTPAHQALLDKKIEDSMDDVDISELPSAYWDPNPYGVEPQLIGSSAGWEVRDENELWNAAVDIVIGKIKADGAVEYLYNLVPEDKQEDDEFNAALTQEAIQYLENQKSK